MAYKITYITPKILFLTFGSSREMASTLVRFQEYYESPKYRNQVFQRREFFEWYKKEYGSKYIEDWDGFNFPSSVIEAVKQFPNHTQAEKNILKEFSKVKQDRYYVIASNKDNSAFVHEMAHALFYLNRDYHSQMKSLVMSIPAVKRKIIFNALIKGKYDESVLTDEAQAYLIDNVRELDLLVRDWKPYIERAKGIFNRYYRE